MIKRQTITVKLPSSTRAHRVLWDRDLPFRPKTERNRVLYSRNTKHRAQKLEFDH